jgi:hypothetical protein
MARVIVGVFPDRPTAEHAIVGLKEAGFDPTHIGFMMRDKQATRQVVADTGVDVSTGAVTGGILGGALGAILAATGTFVIPGVGPFISAGILATAIAGGAAGAIVGGLVGLGVPREEAEYYNRRVHEGAALVTIDAPGREEEARQILLRSGAEDTWNTTPWQSPARAYNTQAGVNAESPAAATMTPVAEPLHPAPLGPNASPDWKYDTTRQEYEGKSALRRTGPIVEPGELEGLTAAEQEAPRVRPSGQGDRGSIVGPSDAIQHGPVTDPYAGQLRADQPAAGPINYDEPALDQPKSPAVPDEVPPDRPTP